LRVYGIVGRKNSGKTHLVVRLVEAACARGLRVATLKHAHHAFDIDHEGKDSFRHRQAGAGEVIVASSQRWALLHENRGEPEATLDEPLARFSPCDLVLVEGIKAGRHPKLEVYRRGCTEAPLSLTDSMLEALVTDLGPGEVPAGRPLLGIDDTEGVLSFILGRTGLVHAA
jgi:molybdopterin-guanine dinucleotide biosynthesis protein MobB